MRTRTGAVLMGVALLGSAGSAGSQGLSEAEDRMRIAADPDLYYLDHHDVSPPLRDMPVIPPAAASGREANRANVLPLMPAVEKPKDWVDPLEALSRHAVSAPAVSTVAGLNFEGVQGGAYPPDTNGAVGATQFVEWVNFSFAVYNKTTGALVYGPAAGNSLWAGFGGVCETANSGDPIVAYDKAASRWVMTQFAFTSVNGGPWYQCVAVSTTSDATGTWRRFAYNFTALNDYPKVGVWPDGYYITFNMFNSGSSFAGARTCALDRNNMITASNAPGPIQCFQNSAWASLMPADLDGSTPPPAGAPNYQLSLGGSPTLRLYKFSVNWATPSLSTFTGPINISVAAYTQPPVNSAVEQPGTSVRLDSLGDRLMFRLAYRNFGTHEALMANHSVSTASTLGVRWYEIRSPNGTPTVYQQGTFAPDATARWMGSLAQDKNGNMAVGYSVSSGTLYPGISYTGRLATDALGTLQAENVLVAGTRSQTNATRWGDYAAMTIDPSDDCTFWFTTEYLRTGTSTGSTRIGSFKFPGCGAAPLVITQHPADKTITVGGSASFTVAASGGVTPYGYQWQYSATSATSGFANLANGGGISGATAATLTVSSATLSRTGWYRARVTDSASPAAQVFSNAAKLTVNPAPLAISQQPAAASVRVGAAASFTCAATGGVTPYAFQWQSSASSGGPFNNLANGGGISGATTATVTINPVASSHAGYYRCRVTDSNSPASQVFSNAAQLSVSPVLVITTQPVNRTVAEGGSTTLSVVASGVAPFGYQWEYSTSSSGPFSSVANGNGRSGATTATLTINPASPAHTGWYRCRVTDSGPAPNQVFSNAASVTVSVAACSPSSTTLCLQGNRFRVQLAAALGTPTTKTYSDESGFFTLFDPTNVEVGVKVLDGRGINGKWWVFHGSLTTVEYTLTVVDTVAGTQRTYFKPSGSLCGDGDTGAFLPLTESHGAPEGLAVALAASAQGDATRAVCTPNSTTLCLLGSRFKVQVLKAGVAQPGVLFTDKTGLFWFGGSGNVEVPVKVLDGTSNNGHYWVFFGAMTDQTYQVVVTDTVSGIVKTYNSPGAFCGNADTGAF